MKIIRFVLLLMLCVSMVSAQTKDPEQWFQVASGTTYTSIDRSGSGTITFEFHVAGASSVSILVQGCGQGGTCTTLTPLTGVNPYVSTSSGQVTFLGGYNSYNIIPTFTGGTLSIYKVGIQAKVGAGSGGAGSGSSVGPAGQVQKVGATPGSFAASSCNDNATNYVCVIPVVVNAGTGFATYSMITDTGNWQFAAGGSGFAPLSGCWYVFDGNAGGGAGYTPIKICAGDVVNINGATIGINGAINTLAINSQTISTVASATTISPTTQLITISGTTAIATMTPPASFSTTAGGCVDIQATGAWTTTTAGNFENTFTAVPASAAASGMSRACWMGTKWNIK